MEQEATTGKLRYLREALVVWWRRDVPGGMGSGFFSLLSFIGGSIAWMVYMAGDAGVPERIAGGFAFFGFVFGVGHVLWGKSALYEIWRRDQPLRDREALHKKDPAKWLRASFWIEPHENGARISTRIISSLIFHVGYTEIRIDLKHDNQSLGEWTLREDDVIHSGALITSQKDVELRKPFNDYVATKLTAEVIVRTKEDGRITFPNLTPYSLEQGTSTR